MTYIELRNATHQWAEARGIVKNGKVFTQTMKLISEFGELCDAIIKDRPHEVKDAIGDIMVVLSNIASIKGEEWQQLLLQELSKNIEPLLISNEVDLQQRIHFILETIQNLIEKDFVHGFTMVYHLKILAHYFNMSLDMCWESAYLEIKDRKGYLNEHGNFVKEGDV